MAQVKPLPLLSLPNEIIRQVFIYSQNFNLALVNRHLRTLLSDTTTLLDFCVLAFTPSGAAPDPSNWEIIAPPSEQNYSKLTTILEASWFDKTFALNLQSRVPHLDAAATYHAEKGLNGGLPRNTRPGPNMHTNRMLAGYYVKMPKKIMCLPWTEEKDVLFGILRSWDVELWPTESDMARLDGIMKEMVAQNRLNHAMAVNDFENAWMFQNHPLY